MRKQLRAKAGWNVGAMTRAVSGGVLLELWPAPHTGPGPGVEPRQVSGTDKLDALRQAVLATAAAPTDEEMPA